jgi:hypothetical protein
MGLILRTSHDPMPVGSTISNTRLTVEQMDNNFIFLQSISTTIITISYNDAINLINNNLVLKNINYLITDCDPTLYGASSSFLFGDGTEIILQGLDTNSFSSLGYGKFYNPKYYDPNIDEGYDVWNPNTNYSLHDIVIYGGRVWRMVTYTENWGNTDYFNLKSDWVPFSYTNSTYYNVVWDEVEYDIKDNYISSRYDVYNNNYVKNNIRTQYFYCYAYPIQSFRWGHRVDIGGIADCNIINSYFGCLNYCGASSAKIYNITLENQSTIFDIQLFAESYFYNIKMNNSVIGSLYFENSNIYNILLENGSFFGSMEISNSSMYFMTITNDSFFGNLNLIDSDLYSLIMSNSNFSNNNFYGSEIAYINMSNDSQFIFNDIYTSSLSQINIDNNSYFRSILSYRSNMNNIIVKNSSYFGNIFLNQDDDSNASYVSNIEVLNNSTISNDDDDIHLDNGSYFDGISVNNYSYITGWIQLSNFAYMKNITLNNRSFIDGGTGLELSDNSNIFDITLNNNSRLAGQISLYSSSFLERISIENSSTFGYNIFLYNESAFENIEIINDSTISGWWDTIVLQSSSYIADLTIASDSFMSNLYLGTSSYFSDISILENSTLGNLLLENNSFLSNLTLGVSSTLGDYIELNNSNIRLGVINDNSSINNIIIQNSYISTFNITEGSIVDTSSFSRNHLYDNSHLFNLLLSSGSNLTDFYITNNSRIEFLNLDNSSFEKINIDSGSEIIEYKSNNSTLGNVNIFNSSGIYALNFNNSYFYGNPNNGIGSFLLDGESVIHNVIYTNIGIPNAETNTGINLQSGSSFNDSILSNSSIYNINCFSSGLNNLTLNSLASIANLSLTSSYITNSDFNVSLLGSLNLNNSNIFGWFLKQSDFINYSMNNSSIINLNMIGSYLNLYNENTSGNLLLRNTNMFYNTIKYQFTYNLAGLITNQYNMNVLIPGSGWYIDRVIVDNTNNPIVSTGNTLLSMGMYNLNQSYVFNSIDTSVLHGNIKIYDFSNGTLSGSVSTSVDYLNLNVGGDDIYSGSIDFEVILKNTAFFNSND